MQNDTFSEKTYPVENYRKRAYVVNRESLIDKELVMLPKFCYEFIDQVVLTKGMVSDRVEKIAQDVVRDYSGKNVTLLVVMKGAITFAGILTDKIREILNNHSADSYNMSIFVEYINAKSYVDSKSTGEVKIAIDEKVAKKIQGRNLLVVEDVFDSGRTLNALNDHLLTLQPESLKYAIMVQKMNPLNLKYNLNIDYIGFLVPDFYIIGYGFDYNDNFRYLNHVCTIDEEKMKKCRQSKKDE